MADAPGPDAESLLAAKRYSKWKTLIPYLYDWFTNHHLVWPSLSCRWGSVLETHTFKVRQRIYLSEQTDGSVPNTLVVANADVVKARVAAAKDIAQFHEENRSPFVKKIKTILHPGEVNKIRECPQHPHIVATHTDSPLIYLWNTDRQPNRSGDWDAASKNVSVPDLVLEGHNDDAEFALAMSRSSPYVASGGRDTHVCLWSLADSIAGVNSKQVPGGEPRATVASRMTFKGHTATVEDVVFHPSMSEQLASVADDSTLLLWDARQGEKPTARVQGAHSCDVHCVDWSTLDEHLIATGSADNLVLVWDTRKLGSSSTPMRKLASHSAPVLRVEWCPHQAGVLASGGEDALLNIWDLTRQGADKPELMFQHSGHLAQVVDFQWNPEDPWSMLSASDDLETHTGGGSLQMWRVQDLIYRPEEEVLAELEEHRDYIVSGVRKLHKPSATDVSGAPSAAGAGDAPPKEGGGGAGGGAAGGSGAGGGGGGAAAGAAGGGGGGRGGRRRRGGGRGRRGGRGGGDAKVGGAGAAAAPPPPPPAPKDGGGAGGGAPPPPDVGGL